MEVLQQQLEVSALHCHIFACYTPARTTCVCKLKRSFIGPTVIQVLCSTKSKKCKQKVPSVRECSKKSKEWWYAMHSSVAKITYLLGSM